MTTNISSKLGETVELPPGVTHAHTLATANTWQAFDDLKVDDGWEHHEWRDDEDRLRERREATIRGQLIIVFPPAGTLVPVRPVETVVLDIVHEAMLGEHSHAC